jgi:predicted aspartyl protease
VRFSYRRYSVDPTPALEVNEMYRPVIPVRVFGAEDWLDIYALVDTGADESYVTEEMAETIGIQPISNELFVVESASGSIEVPYAEVPIQINDGIEDYRWSAVVGIVAEPWPEAILGHAGFLQYFDAKFSHSRGTLNLNRNDVAFP